MAKQNTSSKEGFTIIEVVLVLAIAGLIFLMVFVALPALQRSQRDTQRRNDMSRVDTSLVQYQTNHSNQPNNLPDAGIWNSRTENNGDNTFPTGCTNSTACAFIRDYMNSGSSENDGKPNNFEDPNGVTYSLIITPNWSNASDVGSTGNQSIGHSKLGTNSAGNYTIMDNEGNAFDEYVIYIIPGGRCIGDGANASTKRHFAILYRLEGAGTYCIDDQ